MDMYAMGVAANAAAMASTAGAATQTQATADTSGVSFAELLSTATGMDVSNLSWREIQSGMMLQAMGEMQDNDTPVVVDPTLQQLLQMMKQLSGNGEVNGGNVVDMLRLIEQMQKRLQEIAQENGGEMAGQEMLALMGNLMPQMTGTPMDAATYQTFSADGGQALLETFLQNQPADVMRMLMDMPAQYTGSEATTYVDNLISQLTSGTDTLTQNTTLTANSDIADILMATNGTETEGTGAAAMALASAGAGAATQAAGQSTFDTAVFQAKQQMNMEAETPAPETKTATIDIDSLQQQVDAGTYLQNTALAVQGEAPVETTLPPAMQMAEQLQTAVAQGESQLTVKLMPEELGEVTIQLTRTTEGLSLTLIARSAETQSLLAGQIDALKDAMRPMNVEVESILTQQQYDQMNEQQFGGQHQRQWENMHGAAYYGNEPLASGDDAILASVMEQAAPASALDTYI